MAADLTGLEGVLASPQVPQAHSHAIADVTGLQSELDSKSDIGQGGSDPWTYLRRATDFTTTSATAVDVTGLSFLPTANTTYEIEARLMVRTATATINPRPGWAWATGLTDGVMEIHLAQTVAGGVLFAFNNINASLLIAVGGVPNNTQSWPANYRGMFIAGASPGGTCRVQLASETAGTTVTVKKPDGSTALMSLTLDSSTDPTSITRAS